MFIINKLYPQPTSRPKDDNGAYSLNLCAAASFSLLGVIATAAFAILTPLFFPAAVGIFFLVIASVSAIATVACTAWFIGSLLDMIAYNHYRSTMPLNTLTAQPAGGALYQADQPVVTNHSINSSNEERLNANQLSAQH